MNSRYDEMRKSVRQKVKPIVDINQGQPNRGGRLRDISARGAAIEYVPGRQAVDRPLELNEIVHLNVGTAALPSRIVRMFDNGFAVEFDWSIDLEAAVPNGL